MERRVIACDFRGIPAPWGLMYLVCPHWELGAARVDVVHLSPQGELHAVDISIKQLSNFRWESLLPSHHLYSSPRVWDLEDETTSEWPVMLNGLADSARLPKAA